MTEYEWEIGRFPRPNRWDLLSGYRSRPHPLVEYLDLEYPRESVTWLLNQRDEAKARELERGRPTNHGPAPPDTPAAA